MTDNKQRFVSSDIKLILVQKVNEQGEKGSQDGAEQSDKSPGRDSKSDSAASTTKAPEKRRAPFREFTPSEKIEADHAVDFPADI